MEALNSFKDIHRGGAIVVCGCGASINDLTRPERFITIGVNDIGRRFHPDYLVVVNPREQFTGDRFRYVETSQAKYIFTQLDLGIAHPNIVKFRLGAYGGTDLSDPETLPYTQNSPYIALCLAARMGASRIGLIGVDFTDHHFFAQTGTHQLTSQLATIDEQYRKLGEALRARGVDVYNLSRQSRLTAFPKMPVEEFADCGMRNVEYGIGKSASSFNPQSAIRDPQLKIVSYATTPVAGVPAILARCVSARTPHRARCVWAHNDYGNGVVFDGDIQWNESPAEAEAALAEADVVIVHNGKIAPRHERLLAGKAVVTMAHNYAWNVDSRFVAQGWPGVVIGQYQATLPEFEGWAVAPNPAPLWEAAYQPEAKPEVVTIAFTPSGKHERFPRDHQLYWHGKGYDTTMRALERLAARFPLRLEVIRDRQVSHAEALAMKRRAHIVIDECVTGSYHRNSLEGLATGCVVVNGLGLLPGVTEVFRQCAAGAAEIPFVGAGLDELERALAGLVERGAASLAAEGSRNRQWMEKHWDFARQWEQFWTPVIIQAMRQAGREPPMARAANHALPSHSQLSLDQSQPAQPAQPDFDKTAMNRKDEIINLMDGVSVVIPHGGEARLPLLTATLVNLRQCRGVNEVIVVEMGEAAYAQETARRLADKYIFTRHEGQFERARALNLGAPLARSKLLLWLDNDIIAPPHFVERAAAELQARRLDCLVPYYSVSYLGPQDSENVRRGARNPADCSPANVYYSRQGVHGGAVLVRKEFVMRYGGMHEEFRGWGGEDNAWLWKAQLLGQAANTQYRDQALYHLFHPLSGGYGGQGHIANNPHYQRNLALLREIRFINQRDLFLRRFPPASTFSCPWRSDQRIVIFDGDGLNEEGATSLSQLSAAMAQTLLDWYGCRVESVSAREAEARSDRAWLMQSDAAVIFGAVAARRFLDDPELEPARSKTLAVVETTEGMTSAEIMRLNRAGAVVASGSAACAALKQAGIDHWTLDEGANHHLAASLIQPLSIIAGGAGATRSGSAAAPQPGPRSATLPVWLYWEGECPAWIRECQKTIFAHAADARLLTPESFDELRDRDRDIDLSRLHVAQRADFIRAFLLAKYGGLWIDSDCLVMRSLQPVLELLDQYDFVCHRERQGHFSNGFIAARPASRVAQAYYRRVRELLRSGRPLGWTTLGSEALTEALRTANAAWHELDCEQIQPICWSDPGAFFVIGDATRHELRFNPLAICYMLANQSMQRYLAERRATGAPDLLDERTFFSFLLKRALSAEAPPAQTGLIAETVTRANGWRRLPFCIEAMIEMAPQRVLDLGPGLGRWGMLIREFCESADSNGRREAWRTHLVGVALAPELIAEQHGALYNQMLVADSHELFANDERWDLVIFGDVVRQWPRESVEANLQRALDRADYVLVNTPLPPDATAGVSNGWERQARGQLQNSLTQCMVRYSTDEDDREHGGGAYLFSRTDPKGLKRASPMERIFTGVFEQNLSRGEESVSGPGSCMAHTAEIRQRLPLLISDLGVKSLMDAPCGDFNWLRHVTLSLDQYIGLDIVPQLVAQNEQRFGGPDRQFIHLDFTAHPSPRVDLILCRDCLVHFQFDQVFKALRNFKRSQSTYLLMTHFPNHAANTDIATGEWRTLNFQRPPFNFPPPLRVINEKCAEAGGIYSDKSLALWRLVDLPL